MKIAFNPKQFLEFNWLRKANQPPGFNPTFFSLFFVGALRLGGGFAVVYALTFLTLLPRSHAAAPQT